jgi:hypothetical protein
MAVRELPLTEGQINSSRLWVSIGTVFESSTASRVVFVSSEDSSAGQRESVFAIHPLTSEVVQIDPEQSWFWTKEWLAGEMEAEQEIRAGEYERFDNMDDFLATL